MSSSISTDDLIVDGPNFPENEFRKGHSIYLVLFGSGHKGRKEKLLYRASAEVVRK
jgi:hypothetical protein